MKSTLTTKQTEEKPKTPEVKKSGPRQTSLKGSKLCNGTIKILKDFFNLIARRGRSMNIAARFIRRVKARFSKNRAYFVPSV